MSFLIAVYVNEGIVLASDRRSTYSNTTMIDGRIIQRIGIHTTNSTDKTFVCPNGAGILKSQPKEKRTKCEHIFVFLQKTVETYGIVWYSKEEIRLKFVILHFLTSDLPKNVILHFLRKW